MPSRIYRVRANCYSLCLRNEILVINSLVLEKEPLDNSIKIGRNWLMIVICP